MTVRKVRCPQCRNFSAWDNNPNRPFCSDRCKSRDLGNWASENYRIADDSEQEESLPATPTDFDPDREN